MRRRLLAAIVVVLCAGTSSAQSEADLRATFLQGNALYESGDYDGAIDEYGKLEAAGVTEPTLYYNLGNASYKVNDLAHAVLYYERATRAMPRDRDLGQNLELVRSQLKDKQFVTDRNWLARTVLVLHRRLNASEMFTFTSISYVLLCLLVIAVIFRDSAVVRAVYRPVSFISPGRLLGLTRAQDLVTAAVVALLICLTAGTSMFYKVVRDTRRSDAIVMPEEIPVFSSPTADGTLQFRIHEGTKVTVRERRQQWVRIQLPGGLSGWVEAGAIERV